MSLNRSEAANGCAKKERMALSEISCLLEYEIEALLAALRRDLRHQATEADHSPRDADYHLRNVRLAKRLLEALNPRARRHMVK